MKSQTVARGSPVLLLLFLLGFCTGDYKPVIIVHGMLDGPKELKSLARFITETHPGTEVTVIDLYDYASSLQPLWWQIPDFTESINAIMQKAPNGVHLICFSQGPSTDAARTFKDANKLSLISHDEDVLLFLWGLICRGFLATSPDHNVHTMISLSSPQAGQFGDTSYLWPLSKYMRREVYHFCYNSVGQLLSICEYWKDPHQWPLYVQHSRFLAPLNGDRPHKDLEAWKKNFLRIKKLVLIGGPDDGVITPWQSSLFGFYDSDERVVEMRDQEFYRKDTFGLKTLDARGDLSECVLSGVEHVHWHTNYTVFTSCMEKWLI